MILYGYWQVGKGNIERNEQILYERQEKYALAALLQNEADREYLLREKWLKEREQRIMSEVPNDVPLEHKYHNRTRWTPSHVRDGDKNIQKK